MSYTIQENITHYINYFRRHVELVSEHSLKSIEGDIHSRVLYISIIDAISQSVLPREPNRGRVVNFVGNFCGWLDHDRISLPHLHQLVRIKSDARLEPLRGFVIRRMAGWIPASKILLSQDPHISEVEVLWPHEDGRPIKFGKIGLDWFKHAHLFYTYRNSLIHEFRPQGRHVELWDEDEPYYAQLISYESESSNVIKRSWELQYTAKFFKRLCITGLLNLEKYLLEHRIDPIDSMDWGNYWISGLNI